MPVVVAINHFVTDTDAEVQAVKDYVAEQGSRRSCAALGDGLGRAEDLATRVARLPMRTGQFAPLYPDDMPLFEKIETIAKRIYRADEVLADKKIRDQLKDWEDAGYGDLPVCMAKTQYSFSTDPEPRGAPTGHSRADARSAPVRGAGFVVVICGEIMTMPGLPSVPAAEISS